MSSEQIYITDVGKQIAISGLKPDTAYELLEYISIQSDGLLSTLSEKNDEQTSGHNKFNFCLLFAAMSSPEFIGLSPSRFLPYQLKQGVSNNLAEEYSQLLKYNTWQPYRDSANASKLLLNWINGFSMPLLEDQFSDLRAGKIQGLAKEASWCLSGFSEILAAATKQGLLENEKPAPLKGMPESKIKNLKQLIPAIRLLAWRLNTGFPAEILWMSQIRSGKGKAIVSRSEAVALYEAGLSSYTELRQRKSWPKMIETLRNAIVNNTNERAKEIQELAHQWHKDTRIKILKKLSEQNPVAKNLLSNFFDAREKAFEKAFEELLSFAGVRFTLFDDGKKPGAFDYLIHIPDRPLFIVECKTKKDDSLVDLSEARTVLGAASQHGYDDSFCVTLCNPGVNPDVLVSFADCSRLAIVEVHDIAVGLMRLAAGKLSPQGFHDWLNQPGYIKAENIYVHKSNKTIDSLDEGQGKIEV